MSTVTLMQCGRVSFSFTSGIFKRKKTYNDLMENIVLKENHPSEKSVYMTENLERVAKRVTKKHSNGHKSKVKKILLDEYNSLSIGQLLSYEEKAEKLKNKIEDSSLEDKDKILTNLIEKREKKMRSKSWRKYRKPVLKKIKVVSLITLSEEELKELSDHKGFEGVLMKNKMLDKKWNSLPQTEKERLTAQCEEMRNQMKLSYLEELSKWTISLIKNNDKFEILPILCVKEMKMVLDHQAGFTPKRARGPILIFAASDIGKTLGATVGNSAEKFKSLDKRAIENFNNLAKEEKSRSAKEKKLWEDTLEQKGLLDLIEVWKELCVMHGKRISIYS